MKIINNKLFIYFTTFMPILIIFFIFFTSCHSLPTKSKNHIKNSNKTEIIYPTKTIIDTLTYHKPLWTNEPLFIIKINKQFNKKFFYWNISKEGTNLEATKRFLTSDTIKIANDLIKKYFISQLNKALNYLNTNYINNSEIKINNLKINYLKVYITNNLKINKLTKIDEWWEKYSLKETPSSEIKYFYKVYIYYSYPYFKYIVKRNKLWNLFYKNTDINMKKVMNIIYKYFVVLDNNNITINL